jgi:hypothetical protein
MKSDRMLFFFLGIIAALLLVLVVQRAPASSNVANAGEPAMSGSGLILTAITGQNGQNANLLWVVDAANRRVCVYEYDTNRNTILLDAARNMEYDLITRSDFFTNGPGQGRNYADTRRIMQ